MTDTTTAASGPRQPLGLPLNNQLGPAVPDSVLAYLHAYGDSRVDADGRSALRIAEAILALRRWAAELQTAERERILARCQGKTHDGCRYLAHCGTVCNKCGQVA